MAKRYQIDLIVNAQQADTVAPKLKAGFKDAEGAIAGSGNAIEKTVQKIDVGLHQLQASGIKAMDGIAKAAEKSAADRERAAAIAAKAETKALEQAAKAAEKATADKEKAAVKAAKAESQAISETTKANETHNESLLTSFARYTSFRIAFDVLKNVAKGWSEISTNAYDAATASGKYNNTLRELAALQGKTVQQLKPSQYKLLGETAITPDQLAEAQSRYQDLTPGNIRKGNVSEKDSKEIEKETLRLAAAKGSDPVALATLASLIAVNDKIDTANKGIEIVGSISEGLARGRGSEGQLAEQLAKVAGDLAGPGKDFADVNELSAVIATTSVNSGPGRAGSGTRQLLNALQGTTPQQRESLSDFYGIDFEKDKGLERITKVGSKLEKEQKSGRNLKELLFSQGFNDEDIKQLSALSSSYKDYASAVGARRNFEGNDGTRITADKVRASNLAYEKTPEGGLAISQNKMLATKLSAADEDITAAKLINEQKALYNLKREENNLGAYLTDSITEKFGVGTEGRLRGRVKEDLRGQYAANNIPEPPTNQAMSDVEIITRLADGLKARDIDPGEETRKQTKLLEDQIAIMRGNQAPPVLGAPVVGKGRP